jgi:hypothetical protein
MLHRILKGEKMYIKPLLYFGCLYVSISCGLIFFLSYRSFKKYDKYPKNIAHFWHSIGWMLVASFFTVLSGACLLREGIWYVVTEMIVISLTIWRLNILWINGLKIKEAK